MKRAFAAALSAGLFYAFYAGTQAGPMAPGDGGYMSAPSALRALASPAVLLSTQVTPSSGSFVTATPVLFAWTGPSTAAASQLGQYSGFVLQVDETADFLSPLVEITTSPDMYPSSPTVNGEYLSYAAFLHDATYYWRVGIYDGSAHSTGAWSQAAPFRTDFTAPGMPADFASMQAGTGTITLSWTSQGDDGGLNPLNSALYKVQYSTYGSVAWSTAAAQVTISTNGVLPGASQYYRLENLAANTSYYARLWVFDDAGTQAPATGIANAATFIEYPESVYVDEVGTTTILASAYAPAFTNLDKGYSGVNITTGAQYGVWGSSGSYWTTKRNMNGNHEYGGAAGIGGKVYIVGDSVSDTVLEEYDPVLNNWTTKSPLVPGRRGLAAAALGGKMYVAGGTSSGGSYFLDLAEYDPELNIWTVRAPMPGPRNVPAAAAAGGKLYVFGGYDGAVTRKTTYEYDPAADIWSEKQDMPGNCANASAAPARGYIYVAGCGLTKLYRYDPVDNNWLSGADLPTGRHSLGVAAAGGKVYAFGGSNGVAFSAAEVYDPLTNGWTIISSMPAVSWGLSAAAAGGRVYALGGSAGMNAVFEYTPGVSKLLAGLQPNTQYTLRALTRNQFSATGGESQQVSTYTLAAIAQHPSLPLFGSVSSFSVTVAWSSGTAAGGYNGPGARYVIQASTDAYFRPVAASSDTANIFVALGGLLANTTYYFRAQTFNAGGMTDHSWTVLGATVTAIEAPTGVYFEEIGSSTIAASAYAAAFTHNYLGVSGVNIATGAMYGVWNSTANGWRYRSPMDGGGRYMLAAASLGGKVFAISGSNVGATTAVEVFDPVLNDWAGVPGVNLARKAPAAASLGGRIYLFGGSPTDGTYTDLTEAYDPETGVWSYRAPMPTARYALAAAALGGQIYVAGGYNSGGKTGAVEAYDPSADTWTVRAPLNVPRQGLALGALRGRLYAVAGFNDLSAVGDNEEYDPHTNTWSPKATLQAARSNPGSAVFAGRLLIVGGSNGGEQSACDVFDPLNNSWDFCPPLSLSRWYLAAAAVNGKVYAVGGQRLGGNMADTEEFDPSLTRVFSGLKPNTEYSFRAKARNQAGAETAESSVVSTYTLAAVAPSTGPAFTELAPNSLKVWWSSGTAAGGYNGPGASYRIEYATSANFGGAYWTQPAPDSINALLSGLTANTTYHFRVRAYNAGGMTDYSWVSLGSTVTAVEQPVSVYMDEVGTTTIVASAYAPGPAFTGLNRGLSGVNISLDGAYGVWGSSGNYWTTKAYMNVPRWAHGVASGGGKVYAVGGSGTPAYMDSVEVYDPALNTWSTIASPMTTARRGASAAVIGRKLYVAGGNNGADLNVNEAYDLETGVWSPRAPMPTARHNAAAGAIGGKLYVVGGQGAVLLKVNEAYDPALDSWSVKTGMNVAREGAGYGVIGSMLYVAGGNSGGAIAVNEEYDAIADTWTTRAPMNFARYRMAGAAAGGKFYAFGGFNVSPLKTGEAYDPAGNIWTRLPDMSSARADLLAAGSAGGRLYVTGGYGAGTMGDNEEYTPGTARVFAGLQPNTPHSFAAKARNQAGDISPESAVVSTYTMAAVALFPGGTFSGVTSAGATIYWSSGTGGITGFNGPGASYKLQASTAADFSGNKITSSTIATSAFLDLAANTSYYFRVQAFNAGGMTDYSWLFLGSTVTTVNQPLPAPAAAVGTYTITAAWNPNGNSPDTVYTAQISSFATFTPLLISSVVTSTSVVFGPLPAANTFYFMRVNAVNRSGSATNWTVLDSTATLVETPASVYFDEVAATTITASAYAPGAPFSGLQLGLSAVAVTSGTYDLWGSSGNYWQPLAPMTGGSRSSPGAAALGGKIYVIGGNAGGSALNRNEAYDPAANTWATLANMPTSRDYLALVSVGGRLYAIGGRNGATHYKKTEAYDPEGGAWKTLSDMASARRSFAAAAIGSKIYVAGGYGGAADLASTEVFDVNAGTWSPLAPLDTPRHNLAGAAVNGKFYAIGGYNGSVFNNVEEYDPGLNDWSPKAGLPTPRGALGVAALGGKIYAAGGTVDANNGLNVLEVFDPALNYWSQAAPSAQKRHTLAAAVMGGRLYLAGGYDNGDLASVEAYTPGSARVFTGLKPNTLYSFRAKARNALGVETGESAVVSTWTAAAVALPASGTPFISVTADAVTVAWSSGTSAGGYNSQDASYKVQASTAPNFSGTIYSDAPTTNLAQSISLSPNTTYYFRVQAYNSGGMTDHSWLLLGSTVTRIEAPTMVYADEVGLTSIAASAYAPGAGFTGLNRPGSGVAVTTGPAFDVWGSTGGYWENKKPMTSARTNLAAAALGGKLYVLGGNGGGYSALNEVYDPVSDSWQTKAPMLTARQSLAAAALGGKLYALGGHNGAALGANEEYDPVADTWTARSPLPTPRYGLGAAALNGKIYAVGGFGTGASDKNEAYDPATDSWTPREPLVPARYGLGAVALNGRIHAVGGYAGGYSGKHEAYDPAANSWTLLGELAPRSSLAAAAAGGKIFALGGTTGAESALAEEYDPVSNAWTQRDNLPAPRTNLAAAFLGGRIYAVGGGSGLPQDSNEAYVTGAAALIGGLKPNTQYTFKAAARGRDGTLTAASAAVSTYTLAAVALPAGGNPFQSVQASAVSLQWSSGTAAAGYNGPGASYFLHYSTSPDFKPALGLQTSPDIITANVAGLSANTTYHFRIRAYNAGGMTDYSWLKLGSTMTAVETPTTVVFDTVDVTTIVVSGYAPGAAFTNIDQGLSGLRIAKDGAWSVWGSTGNYWNLRAELTPYRWNTAGAVLNGRVHVAGGWNGGGDESSFSNYHDAYDPALNTWTGMPLLPTRRSVYAAGVMGGKFYVVGGHNASNMSGLATNEAYDPEAGQWVTLKPMPTARTTMGAAVHGGKLYVIGGSVNVTETYDPGTDSWTTGLQPMPTSRNNVGVVSVGNKIYAVGGDSLDSNEEYDPAANTWTAKAPMLFGRYHHGVGAVGGKFYALGGMSGSEITNVEMYDPSADTWTVRAPMPTGRRLMAVVPAKGNLYLLGGFPTPAAGPVAEYVTGAARPFVGLTPNTQYSFKAQARGAAGAQTAESVEVSTWTLAMRPLAGLLSLVTTGQVRADWGVNGNPAGTQYQAHISTSPDFIPVAGSSATLNAYALLANIGSNTTYYLRVRAVNGLNVPTAWTALGSTVTMVNPPVFLPVAAVSTFTVTAAWDDNGNSAGTIYNAQVSADSGFTAVVASTVTELNSVELGPLAVANTYYYLRVNAVNRSGSATAWTPLGSTVTAIEAVSSMAFVSVSSKAVTVQAVSGGGYTWLSEELSGIDIAFGGGYGGWTKLDSAEYTGLQPNKAYSFKARSRNRLGAVTPESAEFSTWTLAAVAAPAGSPAYQSVWLSSAVVAYSSGTAAWGFNASAASYLVEADTGGNFDGVPVSSRTVALAAALDLSPNATWYFRARAYNALNVPGEWALFGSTATQIETPTGINFTSVGSSQISLQVQGTPGFSNLSSGLSSIAKAKNGVYAAWFNSTADTYSGLTPNTQYAFSAKARNLEGRVTPEITVSTWTLAVQPGAAAGFYDAYANSLWFGWSDGGNPAGTLYRAEISTASDYSVIAASSETLNVYASLTALQANTTYYGRVAAVNGAGVSSAYLTVGATSTRIETPAGIYADEVGTAAITASAYSANFSGIDKPGSAVWLSIDAGQEVWGSTGNYWSGRAGLNTGREYLALAAAGGRLYAVGGLGPLATNEEYDPAANAWTQRAAMPQPREGLGAAAAGGRIYAVGGWNGATYTDTLQQYDISANTWTLRAPMPTARYSLAAVGMGGKVYALGGANAGGLDTAEVYDPGSNSWNPLPSMPGARYDHAAAAVNGELYAVGGAGGLTTLFKYDGAAWSQLAGPSLHRTYPAAASLAGKLYLVGGVAGSQSASVEVFDTLSLQWREAAPLPVARGMLGAAALGGKVYAAGGSGAPAALTVYEPGFSAKFGGLLPDRQYALQARARNQAGALTPLSAAVSTWTLAAVTPAQDGVTWPAVYQTSATVAWSSGTALGGYNGAGAYYKLQASTSTDFLGAVTTVFPLSQVSWTVEGLLSNTTYHFRAQAYNTKGMTDHSWLVLGTTVTMAIPPAASGTPFVQVWHEGVEPAWSANGNSDGTAYRLQVSSFANFSEVRSTVYPLYVTTSAVGGLAPNTTWYARAAAVSYSGAQTEYYVIGGTLTPMAAPTDVLFPAVSSLTITAEAWSSYGFPNLAEGQSGLAYWRAGQGWTPWTSASSSVVSGLAPNTRYDIKAKARGQSGLETAESPLVSTYTLAAVSLPQQGPLYEDLDTNMLTVHWSSGTEAEGFNGPGATYRIVSAASGDFAVSPQSYDVTDLFRPFVGLSANTTYYHKVRAYNSAGVAGDWLVLGATATLTGKPGSVAIAAVHPTSVTLTWAVMGAASSGYLVQASTLAGFTGLVRASSTPNGFLGGLTVTGLLANTSYFLRVGSLNHGGTPNFEAALSTMTPAENEPPTITDMELGTDYSWYSALPARTYNINFFDTGGSALENFQVRATTGPLQTGTVNADWTDIATGLDVDSYTADWPLTQGAWDLLADGTNYISVQVFDGSGNKDVREDAFIVFKDSTPPAISHGFDGSVWRSTFGFTVPLQFSDEHSRVEGAQVAVWTSTGLTGVQLWPWTSLFSGADAHQRDENLVMAEAGWNLLAPGTNYFSLRAGDYSLPANTTTWADAFVILKDTVPPPAVADAAAVSGSTWSATFGFGVPADFPSGAADYAMQYSTFAVALATYSVPGSTLSLVSFPGAAAGTPLSFLRWPLSPNTTYYFGVRSADRAGNWSAASNAAGAVTLAEAPVSAAPLVYYSSAAFSWGAVASAGYAAHASTAPDFTGAQLSSATADGGAAGIYVTGLTPNTTYYLRAASLNWAGAPNYSAGYEGVTLAVVPGSAAVYSAVSSVTAAVEWLSGGNSAGTSYLVGISSDGHVSEMYAVPFSSAGPGPYRHKFTGLQPNTTYWFRVLAQGHGGDFTDWLTLGSTMTLPVPPNLTSYEAWESSAAVAWDANGNGAGTLYQLDLSTDALFAPVEVTTVTQGLSFAAGLQLPDTTYYLRLRSLSSGSGQASAYAAGEQVSRAAAPQTIDFYNFGANSVGVYWNGQRNQGGRASGAWTQSGALPSGLHGHAAVVAGDLLVVTGGSDGTGYQAKAWAARLEHDGTLGSWTRTRDLPGARYGHASFFAKGRIYVLGGYDGSSARAEVWSAPLSSSGALGEWREEAPLSQPVYAHGSFGLGDRIYVLGGYNGGARDEAYFADPAADGAIASWTPAGNLPAARYALAAAVALSSAAPRLCVTGGSDGALARSEAWTAAVNGDGTLGGWTAATPLPNGLFAHAMTPYNGALFVLGGNNGSGARTAVLRAAVRYDGSIGPWEAQPSLPQALQSHAAGDRYGRLLALGGYDGAVSRSALYQAPVAGAEYSLEVAGAQFSSAPWSAAGFAQVGSLAPNTLYGFRVKARNSAGAETPYSAQFTTRTYASQPSTAAFGGIYMSSVQVNWIGHDNPAGTVYDVQLSSDAAHTLLASSRSVTTVGHLFTGLDQDHLYYARVRAVNDGGTATAWTALGSTTTRTDPSLDLSSPVITVNQAGDAAWRNAGGALYDVDMTDAGGAYLQRFEVRASTSPAGQPPQTAWVTVAGGLETAGYSGDWALPAGFFDLLAPGTNYISVRAWDHNGNSTAAVDAFYVLKDTEAPVITDGQAGEDFWRMDDAGAAYDVDFADGLSGLAAIEYSASPNQGSGDAAGYGWTQIAAVAAGTAAYTADWGVNFAQLPNDATNFISVRARDRAGNTAAVTGIDVFKVLKYVAGPEVWMTSPSAAYHSALAVISGTSSDARSHASSGVEVSLWSEQDARYWNGAGFLGSSPVWFAAAGTATWSWNPGVAWQDGARYEAVARASDTAGNYSLVFATVAFYFDTQAPVVAPASPSNGETVNSVPALSGSASDLSGISALSLMFRRDADGKWWDFDAGTWTVSGSSAAVAAAANWVYTPPELLKASLENGGTYYYTLYAADNSVPVKVSTFGATGASFLFVDNTAPGAITDLYASTGNAPGNISLSWSAAGDDGGSGMILYGQYRVEYSTSAANAFSTAAAQAASDFTAVSAGSARTRELTGLVAGETYYLRAWTRDDAGNWSALSNGATAQAAPFPDRISGRVMTVSSAGITGVLVEAFDTDGALKASAYTLNDGSGSYVLAPLAAGSYRVQATWEAEEIVSSVGTEGFALGRSDADFRLSIGYELAAIGGELAGYRLTVSGRRALAAGTARVQLFQRGRMVAEAPVDAAGRFRLRGLLPGKYTLRVPAPEGGYKEMSVRVKAGEALVINPLADLLKAAKVYVYPNPARNTVKFHLECGQPGARMQVTVFDLAGRAIKEFRETDFTGNAGGNPDAYEAAWRIPAKVASGVYIYTVRVKFDATGEYKKVTKKFAIVR